MNGFPRSFQGKRILVTGHTGFKGSWLCHWLVKLGAKVYGYALEPPTSPSHYELSGLRRRLACHTIGDIRDRAALTAAMERAKPDVIFHLAAQPLVRKSFETPIETFDVNVMGTAQLLDVVRQLRRPSVIVAITSDKCYENTNQVWGYRESDPMGGYDPYSASKGACELLISSYRRSFFDPGKVAEHGVKLASARAGNVIGGGDWGRDRIVVDAVVHLQQGAAIPVRNPNAIRPWQHVLEPLSGYMRLAAKMLESDDPRWPAAWNFGPAPGDEVSVGELATLFCQHWGDGATWEDLSNPQAPHEATILRLAIDQALWTLDWKPRWNLQKAILRTVHWYTHYENCSFRETDNITQDDIECYEQDTEIECHFPPQ